MTGPARAKNVKKASGVAVNAARATTRPLEKAKVGAQFSGSKWTERGSAPAAFKSPPPISKQAHPSDRARPATFVNKVSEEKRPLAVKASPQSVAAAVGKAPRRAAAANKKLFPVFADWPKDVTVEELDNLVLHFANRYEGCID